MGEKHTQMFCEKNKLNSGWCGLIGWASPKGCLLHSCQGHMPFSNGCHIPITVEFSDYFDAIGIFNIQEGGMAFSISQTYLSIKICGREKEHKCLETQFINAALWNNFKLSCEAK